MKKILIQGSTEFHFLFANSIIDKFYPPAEGYEVEYIIVSRITGRLANLKEKPPFKFIRVKYNHDTTEYFPDVPLLIKKIQNSKYFCFISFLYHDPLFVYLSFYFKKGDVPVFLAPDGMGAYVKYQNFNFRSRVLNTLNIYRFYKRHHINFKRLWLTNWNFGKNGYYDKIYAITARVTGIPAHKVEKVDYSYSIESLIKLQEVFGVNLSSLPSFENIILIIGERRDVSVYEKELIAHISHYFPKYLIYYKRHPNQNVAKLTYLNESIVLINDLFPVELLIAQLKQSYIISVYSNSLLYYNPNCTYFWTYPLCVKMRVFRNDVDRQMPVSHINLLSRFEDLRIR